MFFDFDFDLSQRKTMDFSIKAKEYKMNYTA